MFRTFTLAFDFLNIANGNSEPCYQPATFETPCSTPQHIDSESALRTPLSIQSDTPLSTDVIIVPAHRSSVDNVSTKMRRGHSHPYMKIKPSRDYCINNGHNSIPNKRKFYIRQNNSSRHSQYIGRRPTRRPTRGTTLSP